MSCKDEKSDECASAPMNTLTGGAPNSPSASGSHRLEQHAGARRGKPMALATVAPVVKPIDYPIGRSRISTSQRSAISSIAAVAGVGV